MPQGLKTACDLSTPEALFRSLPHAELKHSYHLVNEETSIGSARRVKNYDAMPAPRRVLPIEVIELSRAANL
jgi:hypothetical protein